MNDGIIVHECGMLPCVCGEDDADFYWINRKTGNYRCLLCGYQFWVRENGTPDAHLEEHGRLGAESASAAESRGIRGAS
jgi:hypothetical protein